jgi:curved DNA-binding protein
MSAQDYYGILGVTQDASTQEIKKAFRKIARECHPDVAGDDPVLAERFKVARTAYETLMDPMTRGRYDRRGQRRAGMGAGAGGSFFDAFYKGTERRDGGSGPSYGTSAAGGHASTKGARHNPENHLDLDDLFNDFGDFGFGTADRRRTRSTTRESAGPPPPNRDPVPGEDVEVELDVPAGVAARGGSVTAVYYRQQRADSWRPGSPDPGLVRVQDIADVRIVPQTTTGAIFRERGLGNAGANGGPYGDLIVRVNVVGRVRSERRAPSPEPEATPSDVVDVSVAEAILGGRIELPTPQGVVRITIPAGTSSGMRLRLKGKGAKGPDGRPEDLYVRVRIVVPRQLDDESRALIEEFARLNPGSPRD